MVRTYRQDKYQLVSPWEKAMKTADASEGRPVNTGKRVYADMKVTQSSIATNGQKNLKLPPITEDPQQMIQFLGEEVGKVLSRSKDKIKTIKKEFVLYDPSGTGQMSKSSAFEILQRYKVPTNENYQKKLLAFFVQEQQPGKINWKNLVEFFENSTSHHLEKLQFSVSNLKLDRGEGKADSTHGRYDSTDTMNETEHKPRKAHLQAFAERRDAGLLLEIERALKNYSKIDPRDLLDQLEDSLRNTCRNDDFLTDCGHVRKLMSKHEVPLNTALTLKCIERLDPHDTGKIEWPKFIEFLHKAIGSSPRRVKPKTPATIINETPTEFVPSKPAWETRTPLSSISNNNNSSYEDPQEYATPANTQLLNEPEQQTDNGWHGYDDSNDQFGNATAPVDDNDPFASYNYMADLNNDSKNDHLQNSNGYDDTYNAFEELSNRLTEDVYQEEDAEAEEAFARNIEEIRKGFQQEEQPQTNPFSDMGERGQLYKRVANALEDKAKPNKGMLLTNDVRKIINYYNLLFDANFPLDQINSMLQRYSKNDQIHCDQVVGMLGKQIV